MLSLIHKTGAVTKLPKLVRRLAGRGCRAVDFAPVYARAQRDAWGYEQRQFESRRFELIMKLASLVPARTALEVGCAEGHLTQRLSPLVRELVACDIVEEAVHRAEANCRECANVRFLCVDVRRQWPAGMFDLLIYSDVLYYFTKREVRNVVCESARHVSPNGHFLFANEWRADYRWHTHPDYVMRQLDRSHDWELVWRQKHVDVDESRSLTLGLWRRTGTGIDPGRAS